MEYTNSQMRELIAEHLHSQRDREILSRRLIDGMTYEQLGNEFQMSSRQIQEIVHRNEAVLFKHLRESS